MLYNIDADYKDFDSSDEQESSSQDVPQLILEKLDEILARLDRMEDAIRLPKIRDAKARERNQYVKKVLEIEHFISWGRLRDKPEF